MPVVLDESALPPVPVLLSALLSKSALTPLAVLLLPVVLNESA